MKPFFRAAVTFLTGAFDLRTELTSMGMAYQGCLSVRNGPNKDRKMHFFHAFALSSIAGFGGGWFGFVWMGKPSSMITNDINLATCIIAYAIVNWIPLDIGYKLGNTLPVVLITTSFAQLFRSLSMMKFIDVAFSECNPSPYYNIPVLGPIVYGTLLGNMSSFLVKGFNGHLQGGVPWAFQNGLIMGSFYHFFVNDERGPIGTFLRRVIHSLGDGALLMGLDERTFAIAYVSLFMQISGLLQLPHFFGPSYSPFFHARTVVEKTLGVSFASSETVDRTFLQEMEEAEEDIVKPKASLSRRRKKKKAS